MIKCKDNGSYTCITRNGKPKSRWDTAALVIENAKYLNEKYPSKTTKLVGYKCSNCGYYHLTTVEINKKKYF